MTDLFDEILKLAGDNTKNASKQVKKIDKDVRNQQRSKAEKEALERKLAKEAAKKSAPPPPSKPKFCIPKLSASKGAGPAVDPSRVQAFLKKKEQEKRKEMIVKKEEKEKLIKLRLESHGGKANKKLAKQFGTTAIELQQRYGTDRDHEEYLKRLQIREEEEADRLNTELRGGIMKALERKKVADKAAPSAEERKAKGPHRVAINKQNSLRYFTKEDSPVPTSSKNKSNEKEKRMHGSSKHPIPDKAKKKAPPPPPTDFNALMKKAEAIQKGEPVPESPPRVEARKELEATSSRRKSFDDSSKKGSGRQGGALGGADATRNERNAKPASSSQPSKYGIGTIKKGHEPPTNAHGGKGHSEKLSNAVSSSKNMPQKPSNSSSQRYPNNAPRVDVKQSSAPKQVGSTPMNANRRFLPGDARYQPGSEPRPGPSGLASRPASSSAMPNRDRPALLPNSRNIVRPSTERKRPDLTRRDGEGPSQKKERVDDEAERARYREWRLKEMRREQMRRREEEEVDDEEYDSEMDSFIDDTEYAELSREEFEDTLKMVNPRYNKKRWAFNERMIDDRFMEAKYRDVSREEMRSAKIGLLEDLREAQRGASFAL